MPGSFPNAPQGVPHAPGPGLGVQTFTDGEFFFQTNSYSYVAEAGGGITFGGAGVEKFTRAYAVAGGLATGGSGVEKITRKYAVSGGITFGGVDVEKITRKYAVAGGITFGGAGVEKITRKYAVAGGLTFSGASVEKFTRAYAVAGGITFGGAAGARRSFSSAATGGAIFGGVDTERVTHRYVAAGGVTFGGVASTSFPGVFRYYPNVLAFDSVEDAAAIAVLGGSYDSLRMKLVRLGEGTQAPTNIVLTVGPGEIGNLFAFTEWDATSGHFSFPPNTQFAMQLRATAKASANGAISLVVERYLATPSDLFGTDIEDFSDAVGLTTVLTTYDIDLLENTGLGLPGATNAILVTALHFTNVSPDPVDVTITLADVTKTAIIRLVPGALRFGGTASYQAIPRYYTCVAEPGLSLNFFATQEGTGEVEGTYSFEPFGTFIASGGITLGGSAAASFTTGAAEAEDSRDWFALKRHAHAVLVGAGARASAQVSQVTSASVAITSGARAQASAGNAGAKAGSKPQAVLSGARATAGSATVAAGAQHTQAGAQARARVAGKLTVGAGVVVDLRGARAQARTGQANASIGPDEIEQELEEILFLLEVA